MIDSIGIALTGLNSATARINSSASKIANLNENYDSDAQSTAKPSPIATPSGAIEAQNTNLAEEIINMKMAEISYKANLNTIKVAGSMFDELLGVFED